MRRLFCILFLCLVTTTIALFVSCSDTAGTCDPEAEEDGVCVCFDETDTECDYEDDGCDTCFFEDEVEPVAQAQNVTVTLRSYAFSTRALNLPVGSRITWVNQGPDEHAIFCASDRIPLDQLITKGQSVSYTFNTPGTFEVIDRLNDAPKLRQTITISPDSTTP